MAAEAAAQDDQHGDITPFTSTAIKTEEKLDLSWASFCHPKLAQCPFNVRDLVFEACLGRGIDGMVFKAQHDGKTIVLKIVSSWSCLLSAFCVECMGLTRADTARNSSFTKENRMGTPMAI